MNGCTHCYGTGLLYGEWCWHCDATGMGIEERQHQPQPDPKVKEALDKLFYEKIDLKEGFIKMALQGFDTWEDYEKYGDMFVPVTINEDEMAKRSVKTDNREMQTEMSKIVLIRRLQEALEGVLASNEQDRAHPAVQEEGDT